MLKFLKNKKGREGIEIIGVFTTVMFLIAGVTVISGITAGGETGLSVMELSLVGLITLFLILGTMYGIAQVLGLIGK